MLLRSKSFALCMSKLSEDELDLYTMVYIVFGKFIFFGKAVLYLSEKPNIAIFKVTICHNFLTVNAKIQNNQT